MSGFLEVPEGTSLNFSPENQGLKKEIRLHSRQEDFTSIPDTVFEALYGGAAYGGKSFLLTLLPLIRGFYKFRGFKGIILRRKFPDLEREVIRLSKEYYPLTGARYNETKHSWEWPEYGSYLDFGHVQHASDIKQYDSAQYNYCAFDELTHFEESMYLYMVGSRVRPGNEFNIAIVRNGTNPGGIGQTFVFNRFIKPCESGYKLLVDKKTTLTRIFIPALPQDNPYGMTYDPDYLNKLEILPDAEKRAKKYGDWHAFEGSVFPEFRPIRFPNEPDNALHVVEPFDIPKWWPRILAIDWGKRAMCVAYWAAISPDGRVYIYRERTWKGIDIPFWATEVGELSREENIVHTVLCGSAWQNRGSETIAVQFERYSNLRPHSSENTSGSRVARLQLLHDFLRWEKKPLYRTEQDYDQDFAQEIYRKFGSEAYAKYVGQFKGEEEEQAIPRLLLFANHAPVLEETIPVCVHADKGNVEDIAEFDGDDPIDALRYLINECNRYCLGLGDKNEQLKKFDAITQKLQQTGDYTSYYRAIEFAEQKSKGGFGIRRRSAVGRRR